MNQKFDASGNGLAVSGRALKPYEGSLYGALSFLTALFNRFRQRNVIITTVAVALAVFLAITVLVFTGAMDAAKATDPVNTAGQLYF